MDTSIVSSGPIFIQPLSVDFSCQSARGDARSALPNLAAEINIRCWPCSLWQQTRSDAEITEVQYYWPIFAFLLHKKMRFPFRHAHSTHLDEFMWHRGGVTGLNTGSHGLHTMLIYVRLPAEPLGAHAETQSCLCGFHPHIHIVLKWARVKCLFPSFPWSISTFQGH